MKIEGRRLSLGAAAGFCLALLAGCGGGEIDEAQSLEQARSQLAIGKPKAAVIALKNAVRANTTNPESRHLLGRAYLDLYQGTEAESELRKALDLGGPAPAVQLDLGIALLMQGKYDEVLSALEVSGLAAPKEAAELRALRGDALMGLGKPDRARVSYDGALDIDRTNARAHLGMARLALEDGLVDEARQRTERVLRTDSGLVLGWTLLGDLEQRAGDPEAAEAAYSRAVEASAVPGTFQLKRAQVRIQLDDIEGARKDVRALKGYVRDHPQVAFTEGLIELKEGNLLKAQTAFETGLAREPGNALATYYLGAVHFQREQWPEAADYLARIGGDFPEIDPARRMLAYARFQTGDLEGAEEALNPLAASGDADAEALELLARIKLAQGDLERGRALIDRAAELDPGIFESRVDLGTALVRNGNVQEGLEELEAVVEREPDSLRAQRALLLARLRAGDAEGASAVGRELERRWPDDPLVRAQLGVLEVARGNLDAARERFEQALEMDPGNPTAATNLARLALAEGRADRARQLYGAILAQHPDHLPTVVSLALLDRQEGDLDAFEGRLSTAVGDHPGALQPRLLLAAHLIDAGEPLKALNLLKEAEREQTDNVALAQAIVRAHLALDDMPSARAAAERLVALDPDNADARYLLAQIHAGSRNRDSLKRELIAALDLDLSNPVSDRLINQLVSSALTRDDADALLEELRERYPDHPRFLEQRAQAALASGALADADAVYRRAMALYPDEPRWAVGLARVHQRRGDQAGAVGVLEDWMERRPRDLTVSLELGSMHLAQGALDRAEAVFRRVLQRDPDNVMALNNLAWLLRSKAPAEALRHAERAAELAGDMPQVMDTLGLVLLEQGKIEPARRLLLKASTAMPESPEIKFHLALAWSRSGEEAKAIALLEPLTRSGADFRGRPEAEALLARLKGM